MFVNTQSENENQTDIREDFGDTDFPSSQTIKSSISSTKPTNNQKKKLERQFSRKFVERFLKTDKKKN